MSIFGNVVGGSNITNDVEKDSKSLVTSGGVYSALKNVVVSGGGASYDAGDLIEIKDGVIRSTLGDVAGEVDSFVSITDDYINLGASDTASRPPWHIWWNKKPINNVHVGQRVHMHIKDANGNMIDLGEGVLTPNATADYALGVASGQTGLYCIINSVDGIDVLTALGGNVLPYGQYGSYSFVLIFIIDSNNSCIAINIASLDNHSDKQVFIESVVPKPVYVKLPDHALEAGDFISIKDGVISSSLGEPTLENIGELTLTNVTEGEEGEFCLYSYTGLINKAVTLNDRVFIDFISPSNEIIFKEEEPVRVNFGLNYAYLINASDVEHKINPNLPGIVVLVGDNALLVMVDGMQYQNYKIKIYIDSYTKLPNKMLNFDDEPTKGSYNLINSGVLYQALQNVAPKLDIDDVPSQTSTNLISSGAVYTALGNRSKLEFIDTPTSNSDKLMTSGSIHTALGNRSKLEFENSLVENSEKLMTSGDIYKAFNEGVFTALGNRNKLEYISTPTTNSEKLMTSGSIYTALGDRSKLEFEDMPIEGSEKLLTSGSIYTALKQVIEDVWSEDY